MRIFATEMNRTEKKELCKKLSDFLLDAAKLIFAALVIGGLLKYDLSGWILVLIGVVATVCCIYASFKLYRKNRKIK